MKLYFVRHAEASYDAPTDHDRPLTARGEERMKRAADVLRRLDLGVSRLYSSPRLRAHSTAKIVARALGLAVEVREELNFSFNVADVARLTAVLQPHQNVMFVGHNPSLSDIVRAMTGAMVDMKKGGLARIDIPEPGAHHGELVWLIAPKVFDALDD